ncbi:hypothetical protein SAMN06297387_101111 [Streptomyces zhaozhouensis]|uniref:Uncharacterized protein n=1 Tax=Streptomyces zhaozhouensis TaxID=1300267 RepID=A0A286DID6_9ACTN|nr:hypothetical protein [Streptomyces zhaozhouensis]SOD58366.1 hypothetical protein SAMN06297387_101111 [Streptomyces zhaozhouensis]
MSLDPKDDRPVMPPVRLPSVDELARQALAAPLLSRALRLAAWAEGGVPVGAGGELLEPRLAAAVDELALGDDPEGEAVTVEAWNFAVDSGLVSVVETAGDGEREAGAEEDHAVGLASPDKELADLADGDPEEVLGVWSDGLEVVLSDVATPSFEELLGEDLAGLFDEDGQLDPDAIDVDALEWDAEAETGLLDSVLGHLYLLGVTDEDGQGVTPLPLPMVAAAVLLPDDAEELTDEALEDVSSLVVRLDQWFRVLADTGLLVYRPIDDEVLRDDEDDDAPGGVQDIGDADLDDLTRYGQVRLTPLGFHAVRARMREAGVEAPLVGELTAEPAGALLDALTERAPSDATEEAQRWLAEREPAAAARELLAAARGDDPAGPARRLGCQLALALLGTEAEPALREVLDDPELGGLARVWLVERSAADVPPPPEEMVFWLTIDTLAAQLGTESEEEESAPELRELVTGLVDQNTAFLDRAWRTEHPATADVLEAVGRMHPDRQLAKQARKAAFKARSRSAV